MKETASDIKKEEEKKKTKSQDKDTKATTKVKVFVPQKEVAGFEAVKDLSSLEPVIKTEKEIKPPVKKVTAPKTEAVPNKELKSETASKTDKVEKAKEIEKTEKIQSTKKPSVKQAADAKAAKTEAKTEPIIKKAEAVIQKAEPIFKAPVKENLSELDLDDIEHINKIEEKALNEEELNLSSLSDLGDFIIKPTEQPKVITPVKEEIKEPIPVVDEPIKNEQLKEVEPPKDVVKTGLDKALTSDSTSILFGGSKEEPSPSTVTTINEKNKAEINNQIETNNHSDSLKKGVSVMDNYMEKKEEAVTLPENNNSSDNKKEKKAKKEHVKRGAATGWIIFNTFMNLIFFVLILYSVNNDSFNITYIFDFFKKLFT